MGSSSYKRPSKRTRQASQGDIYTHLLHGCCLGCIIRPPNCDVTDAMLEAAWPKYRHQIVSRWQAHGGEVPWGVRVFEGVGE
jgi:hypothetical protein